MQDNRTTTTEKRKYAPIKIMEPKLIAMREAGKTNREIAEYFGLEIRQIENWINRYYRKQAHLAEGLPPKRRGRPRKHPAPTSLLGIVRNSPMQKMGSDGYIDA